MTIFAGIAEFERDLIRERTGAESEASNLDGRESLLWIRVNWHSVLFRKGSPSGALRRFLMSIRQRFIDSPLRS
jgi:DNA invertase Pin-like site-specific DNA recombinase